MNIDWSLARKALCKKLKPAEVCKVWKMRDRMEIYQETMLKSTASLIKWGGNSADPASKMEADALVTTLLERMDAVEEKLDNEDGMIWFWRFDAEIKLRLIGEFIPGKEPENSKNLGNLYEQRASTRIKKIAESIADDLFVLANGGGMYEKNHTD